MPSPKNSTPASKVYTTTRWLHLREDPSKACEGREGAPLFDRTKVFVFMPAALTRRCIPLFRPVAQKESRWASAVEGNVEASDDPRSARIMEPPLGMGKAKPADLPQPRRRNVIATLQR